MDKICKKKDNFVVLAIIYVFLLMCFYFIGTRDFQNRIQQIIRSDGLGYYAYLPAFFIHNDLSFKTLVETVVYPYGHGGGFSLYGLDEIRNVYSNAYAIGVAILQAPFFLIAHFFTKMFGSGRWSSNGFSLPYQIAALVSQIFYVNFGIMIIYKSLRKFFNSVVSALALVSICFSTGIIYYTVFGENFSHSYSFFAIAIYLYFVYKAYETRKLKYHICVGLSLGLVACCRSINVLVGFIYIFYNVRSFNDMLEMIKKRDTYIRFLIAFLSFLAVFSIQMFYWKFAYGSFLVNSYGESTFNWSNPQIGNLLFSLWRGLCVWHPIYLLILLSFFFMKNTIPKLGIWIFLISFIYVSSSWHMWWYGWSFGQRTFNDVLPILAFPFAALIEKIYQLSRKKWYLIKYIPFICFLFIVLLLSMRNVHFISQVSSGTFPVLYPDIDDYKPYRLRDFIYLRYEENLDFTMLEKILANSDSYLIRLNERVNLTDRKSRYQKHGWSDPEGWGTWTDGKRSVLAMRVNDIESDLVLDMDVKMIFNNNPVEIMINNNIIGNYEFSLGNNQINISKELIPNGNIIISFSFNDIKSPKDMEISEDTRQLGIGVAYFNLKKE